MTKSNLTIETSLKIINELKEENNKLKRLNEQLTKHYRVKRRALILCLHLFTSP